MNQADRDAEKWMEKNQQVQQRKLIEAKECGYAYYINQYGDLVVLPEKEE